MHGTCLMQHFTNVICAPSREEISTTSTNPLGATTTYMYDGTRRLQSIIDPMGGRTTYGAEAQTRRTVTSGGFG
jgi:YD repeat-containing protein